MLNDFFVFSRAERRAVIVLSAVAVLALAASLLFRPAGNDEETMTVSADSTKVEEKPEIHMVAFDPNTADSATLRTLGLTPFVASNIVKYRRAGGQFRKADDLARIYGMDEETMARIRPYVFIAKQETYNAPSRTYKEEKRRSGEAVAEDVTADDTLLTAPQMRERNPYAEYMQHKVKAGEIIDLNKADSAELVRIPGIGPHYASQIVRLRKQLGGFVAVSQLNDIPGIPDIGDQVTIGEGATTRIRVNEASLKTLRDHPYIGYYRAKAIVTLRQREGRVVSLRQLSFLDEFSDEDIKRLEPYLSFE